MGWIWYGGKYSSNGGVGQIQILASRLTSGLISIIINRTGQVADTFHRET